MTWRARLAYSPHAQWLPRVCNAAALILLSFIVRVIHAASDAGATQGRRLCRQDELGKRKCAPCEHQLACAESCGCRAIGGVEPADTTCTSKESLTCVARACCPSPPGAKTPPRSAAPPNPAPPELPLSSLDGDRVSTDVRSPLFDADTLKDTREMKRMGACNLEGEVATACVVQCGCTVDPSIKRLDCPSPSEVACLRRQCCSQAPDELLEDGIAREVRRLDDEDDDDASDSEDYDVPRSGGYEARLTQLGVEAALLLQNGDLGGIHVEF